MVWLSYCSIYRQLVSAKIIVLWVKEKENMMAFWGIDVFRNTNVFPPPKYLWCVGFYWGHFSCGTKGFCVEYLRVVRYRDSETVLGGRVEAVENNPNEYSGRHPIDTVWLTYSLGCCWKHCTSVVSLYVQTFSTSAFMDSDSIIQHTLLFWNLRFWYCHQEKELSG
jgi:hypothetical protein